MQRALELQRTCVSAGTCELQEVSSSGCVLNRSLFEKLNLGLYPRNSSRALMAVDHGP